MPTVVRNKAAGRPGAAAQRPNQRSKIVVPGNTGVKIVQACTIRKPAAELYRFWRDFANIPQITKHPIGITVVSETESRWSVPGPGKTQIEWSATIINDKPDALIAWRSLDGADIPNAGSIRFETAPGDEGTEVTVALEYQPPGGKIASLLSKVTGKEAGQQVGEALRRFKALMEAGEIPTIEGQSVGEPQRSKKMKGKR